MRLGQTSVAGILLCACATIAACRPSSMESRDYRSARKNRSALDLAKYLATDDPVFAKEARSLLNKHYDFALKRSDKRAFQHALLSSLQQAGDPRIHLVVEAPTLLESASPALRGHFPSSRDFGYWFEGGANEAASVAYAGDLVAFDERKAIGAGPAPRVTVKWSIGSSDVLFEGPTSLMLGMNPVRPEPIGGIELHASLRFSLPGHAQPFLFETVVTPTAFEYQSYILTAKAADLYVGMLQAASRDVVAEALEAMADKSP